MLFAKMGGLPGPSWVPGNPIEFTIISGNLDETSQKIEFSGIERQKNIYGGTRPGQYVWGTLVTPESDVPWLPIMFSFSQTRNYASTPEIINDVFFRAVLVWGNSSQPSENSGDYPTIVPNGSTTFKINGVSYPFEDTGDGAFRISKNDYNLLSKNGQELTILIENYDITNTETMEAIGGKYSYQYGTITPISTSSVFPFKCFWLDYSASSGLPEGEKFYIGVFDGISNHSIQEASAMYIHAPTFGISTGFYMTFSVNTFSSDDMWTAYTYGSYVSSEISYNGVDCTGVVFGVNAMGRNIFIPSTATPTPISDPTDLSNQLDTFTFHDIVWDIPPGYNFYNGVDF